MRPRLHEPAVARERMVARQIEARGVRDKRVLEALRAVPRERFVEPDDEALAYEDGALPIAGGQTISQPYVVARMFELAAIGPADRVLDVGTGSGYAAAVASHLAQCLTRRGERFEQTSAGDVRFVPLVGD